jgi:diguanylate cyclase (GGDEF)-like protein
MIAAPLAVAASTIAAAAIAAAVTMLVLGLAFLLSRRPGADGRAESLVHDLESRMEAMRRELADALEETREETRRSRVLGELAGSIDLDEVVRRTLDAAGALPGADAALVTVVDTDGEPKTVASGLSEAEIAEHGLGRPPAGRRIRSMTIAYDPAEEMPDDRPPIRAGLAVPVQSEVEAIGVLTIFMRDDPSGVPTEEALAELEALALRAGPALDNARRFREARQLADLDALTGLHNRRYFHETLAREVARAQRYGRHLALVVFDLDDFKAINDRIGHLAGDAVLAAVADRVRDVVRSADVACRVGGDEFAIILPESVLDDADQLYRRVQTQISSRPLPEAGRLLVSAGIAELQEDEDAVAFFQRADDALYRAKAGGKGRVAPGATAISPAEGPTAVPRSAISEVEGHVLEAQNG